MHRGQGQGGPKSPLPHHCHDARKNSRRGHGQHDNREAGASKTLQSSDPASSEKDKEVNCVLLFVYWDRGGCSPLGDTGNNPSGVASSFSPATKEKDHYRYNASRGLRYMAAPSNRMSRKLILSVFERAKYEIEHKLGKAWDVLQKVCEREQVTLG